MAHYIVVLGLLPDMDIYIYLNLVWYYGMVWYGMVWYGMYDVIIVLLFILYTGLENFILNRCELQNLQISLITSRMYFV
jgi:hypothetical protein